MSLNWGDPDRAEGHAAHLDGLVGDGDARSSVASTWLVGSSGRRRVALRVLVDGVGIGAPAPRRRPARCRSRRRRWRSPCCRRRHPGRRRRRRLHDCTPTTRSPPEPGGPGSEQAGAARRPAARSSRGSRQFHLGHGHLRTAPYCGKARVIFNESPGRRTRSPGRRLAGTVRAGRASGTTPPESDLPRDATELSRERSRCDDGRPAGARHRELQFLTLDLDDVRRSRRRSCT